MNHSVSVKWRHRRSRQVTTPDLVSALTDTWPDLHHELADLVDLAGMPPGAALQSATLIAARAAGQERDMGSIEKGKLANMVVLTEDPSVTVDNLKSVVATIKRGRAFERKDFVPLKDGTSLISERTQADGPILCA